MRHYLHRTVALVLALAMAGAALDAVAQERVTSASGDEIRLLRESAAGDRSQIETQGQQASALRQQAQSARRNGDTAAAADKEGWLVRARELEAQAAAIGEGIRRLTAAAEEKEARARRLEAAIEEQKRHQAAPRPASPPPTPTQPASGGNARADMLRHQAAELRRQAAEQERIQRGWIDIRSRTIAEAERATLEAERLALREAAALYNEHFEQLEQDALDNREAAAELERFASELEREDARYGDPATRAPLPAYFVGKWGLVEDTNVELRIVQPEPQARPEELAANSRKHAYRGQYNLAPTAGQGRITLGKTPAAPAMNADVPDWARRQVEGQLKWRVEVDTEDLCSIDTLTARWYPGEISWNEAERKAWLSGEGKPVEFEYKRLPEDPVELSGEGTLSFVAVSEQDGVWPPVNEIARGIPFRLRLVLPADMGKRTGQTATVIVGASGGGTASVQLRGAPGPGGPWIYMSEPLTFESLTEWDAFLAEAGLEWIMGAPIGSFKRPDPAGAIEIVAPNGASINVSFGPATDIVTLYETPLALAIGRVKKELDDLDILLRTAIVAGTVAADDPETARRLRQIRNARILFHYRPPVADPLHTPFGPQSRQWPAHMGLAIALAYLQQANSSEAVHQDRSPAALPPNRFGISYQSTYERNAVEAAIAAVQEQATPANYLRDLAQRTRARIDSGAVVSQIIQFDVNDIMAAFRGTDWDGNKVDRLTQNLARVRLTLGAFLAVAGVHGKLKAPRARIATARARAVEATRAPRLPGRKPPPMPWREPAGAMPGSAVTADMGTAAERLPLLQAAFGTTGFTVSETAAGIRHGFRQTCARGACLVASLTYAFEARNVAQISIRTLVTYIEKFGLKVAGVGMNLDEARFILTRYGATTKFVDFSLEAMETGLAKGKLYFTTIGLKSGAAQGISGRIGHGVVITGVKRLGGKIYAVEFFDWNARGIVTMSRKPFEQLQCGMGQVLETQFAPGR